jgi:hypothetical protein
VVQQASEQRHERPKGLAALEQSYKDVAIMKEQEDPTVVVDKRVSAGDA